MLVVPFVTPVTSPAALTVATAGTDEDHVPVVGDPVKDKVEGIHNTAEPDGVMLGNIADVP
jgi:hypothetical protein